MAWLEVDAHEEGMKISLNFLGRENLQKRLTGKSAPQTGKLFQWPQAWQTEYHLKMQCTILCSIKKLQYTHCNFAY
ncbi:hypothetical protein A6770_34425 [Nostoc minutum NIES-26]|uniref:Uncharacterized protein n=1 Tax=Nostoc minutum NIES-26 TaxID=1844469 RepID=A0A367S378_9NOSO|nr:hypothetical protein A6770_34425 [Nostoc minutum NIES-26]